jgi:hypothetical protein
MRLYLTGDREAAQAARIWLWPRVAGALAAAMLAPWWLALGAWAHGISGYLGAPGAGALGFGWLVLTIAAAVVVVIGLPSHLPTAQLRRLPIVTYLGAAVMIALPNLISGIADGISGWGAVVGGISAVQVVLLVSGLESAARIEH